MNRWALSVAVMLLPAGVNAGAPTDAELLAHASSEFQQGVAGAVRPRSRPPLSMRRRIWPSYGGAAFIAPDFCKTREMLVSWPVTYPAPFWLTGAGYGWIPTTGNFART